MSIIISAICAILLFWLCVKIYENVKFIRRFAGIKRIQETIPYMLPYDLYLQLRKARNNNKSTSGAGVKVRKGGKVFPRLIFRMVDEIMKQYYTEDIVVSFAGSLAMIHALRPEAAEAILGSPKMMHKDFLHAFLKPWLGNGLFGHPGSPEWKSHRRMITPALHFRILEDYAITMNEAAVEFVEEMRQVKSPVDILPVMRLCTFAILFETALGIKVDKRDPDHVQFLGDCDELADLIMERFVDVTQWPDLLFERKSQGRRTKAASDRISTYIYRVLDAKMKDYSTNNNVERQSFIDIVLKMHMDGLIDRRNVRDQIATFIVGGFDTTATTLSFTLHLLAKNPEVMKKLQLEVRDVVGDDLTITKDHLKKMPYIDAVCKESLRMFPPLPLLPRNVRSELRVGKHLIPAGTFALVHVFHLHRNPNVWEKPLEFLPERFMEDVKRHPYSFIPFSAGPRNCIGQKFASQEDRILLSHIVRAFDLRSDEETLKIRLSLELILRPSGSMCVEFIPRTQVSAH